MYIYRHLSIEEFLALSKTEKLDLSESEIPLVLSLEKADQRLIDDVGSNALKWLKEAPCLALDCRRIVEGQIWKVPILQGEFPLLFF